MTYCNEQYRTSANGQFCRPIDSVMELNRIESNRIEVVEQKVVSTVQSGTRRKVPEPYARSRQATLFLVNFERHKI
jgi:hypothetical protein